MENFINSNGIPLSQKARENENKTQEKKMEKNYLNELLKGQELLKGHDCLAIANEFIDIVNKKNRKMGVMRLVKYVYFAHGYCLGITGNPLIKEKVEVWENGPVVFEVYKKFLKSEKPEKPEKIEKAKDKNNEIIFCNLTKKQIKIIKGVYKYYKKFYMFEISNMTHCHNGPWDKNKKDGNVWYNIIPNKDIKEYYSHIFNKILNVTSIIFVLSWYEKTKEFFHNLKTFNSV